MSPKATFPNQQAATGRANFTTDFATSKDGTKIGYRQYGHGPNLVLVQGGMGTAYNYTELAEALADTFTVYAYDRRGRGLTPYEGQDYTIQEDIDDLNAVLTKTNTQNVFALSTGALIALKASLILPNIKKLAVYEPGLSVNGSTPMGWAPRYEKEMAAGDVPAALVTGMLGPKMAPPIMQFVPRPILKSLIKKIVAIEDKEGSGGYDSMRSMIPTLHHDITLLNTMSGKIEDLRNLKMPVLVLNGSKSAAFQRFTVASLAKVIPNVKHIEFAGLDHAGAWNYDKQRNAHGNPKVVAQALKDFFA